MDGNWIADSSAGDSKREDFFKIAPKWFVLDNTPANASIKLVDVVVEQPDMSDPRGDLERLLHAVLERCDLNPKVGITVLQTLQSTLRSSQWRVTCVIRLADQHSGAEIIDVRPDTAINGAFGLAVDIGTTTIAAQLCNLITGDIVTTAGMVNPQVRYGADLTSRVSHVMMDAAGQVHLTDAIRDGLADLVHQMRKDCDISASEIVDAVFVCNPIMHHLYLGLDPTELGQAPFTAAISGAVSIEARDVGLPIHPHAKIYLPPSIASHVGADAAAVVLSQRPHDAEAVTLIVDIGTNAEIFLGNKHGLVATSCPTGPAFEGAVISCGQRADIGAIETVRIDPVTKHIRFKVIGTDLWSDDPQFESAIATFGVTGICGSGVIEMVAELRMAGIIDETGRMGSPAHTGCMQCFANGRTFSVSLYRKGDKHIIFTSNDVREVQMAKAALYASIRLLMDDIGVQTVDRIVLAGSFGSHISTLHALVLGLVPDCDFSHMKAVENAAADGARRALFDVAARHQIEDIAPQIRNVETAVHPAFQDAFLAASAIPNALDVFPHLTTKHILPTVDFRQRKPRKRGATTSA